MPITLYGPDYSTYVRTARLVLEEKGAPYELVKVDLLQGETKEPAHLARNPFAQVPVLDHEGFRLYETTAVARYLDRVLPGPALTPSDPKAEARMNQIIGIIDAHAYQPIIWGIFVPRVMAPMMGGSTDEAKVRESLEPARLCLAELDRIVGEGGGPLAAGAELSLADLYLAPVVGYLHATPEAAGLMAPHAALKAWWQAIAARPSFTRTEPQKG